MSGNDLPYIECEPLGIADRLRPASICERLGAFCEGAGLQGKKIRAKR
jgi:hypothetical protein